MTSILTLRTSNLKLPPSFVELDREEMSYVEGGKFVPIFNSTQFGFSGSVFGIAMFALVGIGLGACMNYIGGAFLAAPDPSLITKIAGVMNKAVGWYAQFLGSSAVVCAFIAVDRARHNQHFTFGVETVFGAPVTFSVS